MENYNYKLSLADTYAAKAKRHIMQIESTEKDEPVKLPVINSVSMEISPSIIEYVKNYLEELNKLRQSYNEWFIEVNKRLKQ